MKLVRCAMIDDLTAQAQKTRRLRLNHNIHDTLSDPIQRLFIAAEPDSYFRPHRHAGKSEFVIVLRGSFDVLLFDEKGVVTERLTAYAHQEVFALEIPADCYHTWIPREPASVFFEVKQGPYDPATSLLFAPWSPAENSEAVGRFQEKLRRAHPGEGIT